MARRMVTQWGMSDRLGPVSYKMTDDDPFLGREIHQNRHFSEHTMEIIDDEVTQILQSASQVALELLKDKREKLESLTKELVEREELDRKDIEAIIGPSVHTEKDLERRAQELASQQAIISNGVAGEKHPDTDPAKDEVK
jgi:cell division protease FtsH